MSEQNRNQIRPAAPKLPATVQELLAGRKSLRFRSLNDDVDDLHLKLWENLEYRKYFEPIWREDTVEGSFIADDVSAAGMLRAFACSIENKDYYQLAARAKLQAIVRSLHVVCKRLSVSRQERRRMVGDEVVGDVAEENNNGYGQ